MSLLLYPNVFSSGHVILETQCLMYKESNLFVYIFVVSCQFFQVIVKICPITLKIGMHSWNPHPPPLIKREVGPSKN